MLLTMLNLRWTVRVHYWTWHYSFTQRKDDSFRGAVTWRDPFNNETGTGTWSVANGLMTVAWDKSTTREKWEIPMFPDGTKGTYFADYGTYELNAVAQNYYYTPGDVSYTGEVLYRTNGMRATIIYKNEVRTGGSIAWICCNPGNIRNGDKFGAFPGKRLKVKTIGEYAIFPDDSTGLMAVIKVLRAYGRVTLLEAMRKYAPVKDGNNPDQYAKTLAEGMKIGTDKVLTTLSDEQMMRLAILITGVEKTVEGTRCVIGTDTLPVDVGSRVR